MEDALHVQRQDPVPGGVVEALERGAPGGAGIVDQDVQPVLALGQHLGELPAPGLGGEVSGQGDAGPVALAGNLGRGRVADVGLARGDVHVRSGLGQAAGDHEPDASGATCYERSLAFDREQVGHQLDDSPPAQKLEF